MNADNAEVLRSSGSSGVAGISTFMSRTRLAQDVPASVHLLPACAGLSHHFPAKSLITNLLDSGSPLALSAAMQVPWRGAQVSVAKITGQGLTSIAILVALLWTCVIGERVIFGRATTGAAQVVRAMRELRLKIRREPAATPARPPHRRLPTEVG
jgi:hypothetical protein